MSMQSSIDDIVPEAVSACPDASEPLTSSEATSSAILPQSEVTVPTNSDEPLQPETLNDASIDPPPVQPPPDPDLVKEIQDTAIALTRSTLSLKHILMPLAEAEKPRLYSLKPSWSKPRIREVVLKSVAIVNLLFQAAERYADDVNVWASPGRELEMDRFALQKFRRDVDKMLLGFKDTLADRPVPKSALTSLQTFNAYYSKTFKEDLGKEEPEGAAAVAETGSAAATQCPLEQRMTALTHSRPAFYDLGLFVAWASQENARSQTNDMIGRMRSAHLFRSHGLLHHEFALICFGGGETGPAESWIRVERAARQKAARSVPLPQADSLGPLFRGVPVRESLTIRRRKQDLCGKADELASVTIDHASLPPSDIAHTRNDVDVQGHLSLFEIAAQLAETSNADPLYQLFSANCRWFARRTILSIAQRLGTIGIMHSITWVEPKSNSSSLVTLDALSNKLLDDPFGGRQLAEGDRAREIEASNLLSMVQTSMVNERFAEGVTRGYQAIRKLEEIQKPNRVQLDLMYHAYWYTGAQLVWGGPNGPQIADALLLLEKARGLVMGALRPPDIGEEHPRLLDDAYAECLSKVGRHDEAFAIREHLIATIRERYGDRPELPEPLYHLANSLMGHATRLLDLERLDRVLEYAKESVRIWRWLVAYRPDLHKRGLGTSLVVLARSKLELGPDHYVDAHTAALESLEHTREVYARDPDSARFELARGLDMLCRTLRALGRPTIELEAINEERSGLWEKLYRSDPVSNANSYRMMLGSRAVDLLRSGRHHEAANLSAKAIGMRDDVLADPSRRYGAQYRGTLHEATIILFRAEDPRSLAAAEAGLAIIRDFSEVSDGLVEATTDGPENVRRLLYLARIRHMPYHSDPDWTQNARESGCRAARLAITLCERPSWNEPLLLAECHSALSDCQATLLHPRDALSAILPALRICDDTAPAYDQHSELLEEVMDRCDKALHLLAAKGVDLSDDSVLPDTRSALHLWRTLLTSYPTSSAPEKFSNALCRHATWVTETFYGAEDAHYFDDAISFARELCAPSAPFALLQALYLHAIFLWRNPTTNGDRARAELGEAFELLPRLTHLDQKEHAVLVVSYGVANAYVAALRAAHRSADAIPVSEYAIQSSRTLYSLEPSPENASKLMVLLYSHAGLLGEAQQFSLAHNASVDAVEFARELYNLDADRYRDELIVSLNNFAWSLMLLDRRSESIAAALEALMHIRTIRIRNLPSTIDPMLRRSWLDPLKDFALADTRTPIARRAALAVAEAGYDAVPSQSRSTMMRGLYFRLATELAVEGERQEAVAHGEHWVARCRDLLAASLAGSNSGGQVNKEDLESDLAKALHYLAANLLELDRVERAIPLLSDCVTTYRTLLTRNPTKHCLALALALYARSSALYLYRLDAALSLSQEGSEISRTKLTSNPDAKDVIPGLAVNVTKEEEGEGETSKDEGLGRKGGGTQKTKKTPVESLPHRLVTADVSIWVRGHAVKYASEQQTQHALAWAKQALVVGRLAFKYSAFKRGGHQAPPLLAGALKVDMKDILFQFAELALELGKEDDALVALLEVSEPQFWRQGEKSSPPELVNLGESVGQTLTTGSNDGPSSSSGTKRTGSAPWILGDFTSTVENSEERASNNLTGRRLPRMPGLLGDCHVDDILEPGALEEFIETTESCNARWRREGKSPSSNSNKYEELGLALAAGYARWASALYALDRRRDALDVLAKETSILTLVLVEQMAFTPLDVLHFAVKHRGQASQRIKEGDTRRAIGLARQFLLISRLAFKPSGGVLSDPMAVRAARDAGWETSLEDVLHHFAQLATETGDEEDAEEAMLEASEPGFSKGGEATLVTLGLDDGFKTSDSLPNQRDGPATHNDNSNTAEEDGFMASHSENGDPDPPQSKSLRQHLEDFGKSSEGSQTSARASIERFDELRLRSAGWHREGKPPTFQTGAYEKTGIALSSDFACTANTLYGESRREEADRALTEAKNILLLILTDHEEITPVDLLRIAMGHRDEATRQIVDGYFKPAIGAARYYLLICRVAFELGGESLGQQVEAIGKNWEASMLEALRRFTELAESTGDDEDQAEAVMEIWKRMIHN